MMDTKERDCVADSVSGLAVAKHIHLDGWIVPFFRKEMGKDMGKINMVQSRLCHYDPNFS
jgi:hypothetical protein